MSEYQHKDGQCQGTPQNTYSILDTPDQRQNKIVEKVDLSETITTTQSQEQGAAQSGMFNLALQGAQQDSAQLILVAALVWYMWGRRRDYKKANGKTKPS